MYVQYLGALRVPELLDLVSHGKGRIMPLADRA